MPIKKSIGACSIAAVSVTSSRAILGIRCGDAISDEFLYYWLVEQQPRVKAMGQHGTQANLNARIVRGFAVDLPSRSEQTAIAAVLTDMDAELTALELRRDKTRLLKQGMMQELLTGRTRLV